MRDAIALDSNRLHRLQQTPLWDFALAFYAKPGIEEACLTLQEEAGVDVCELLLHCWLYSFGLEAKPSAFAPQREQRHLWQRQVTEVLRTLRRDLKASAASNEPVAALREIIKQAELLAERENLQRWQAWVWETPSGEQRVVNASEKSSDAANWLRKQLFLRQGDGRSDGSIKCHKMLLQALQTLTRQLDPH
nr:TIGR02444 family protein [uncultured Halomonas sp.]